MVHKERGQLVEHIIVTEVPRDLNRQTFPGIFIHHDEQAQRPPVGGAERREIIGPDMMSDVAPL